ncbi:hypothetical protein [Sphingomonas sp.]|nr:hypothetical protein [Sphingomonas sp.]HWK36485.1 hypothetical protein [Sphingomonas sp.]
MKAAAVSGQRAKSGNRTRWERPVIRRIEAGDAEVGVRAAQDGSFTGS